MQSLIVEKPYRFIPPKFSSFWHGCVRLLLPWHLRKEYGISSVECVGFEKLKASLDAGHGVILTPNHCRPCDPMILDSLAAKVGRPFSVIASWHVFMSGKLRRFLLPRMGGFSVFREGLDRESLKCAVNLVVKGEHPLVIFPEGVITRGNDRLVGLMDGPSFIARAAARQRTDGKVVIHPVFIRYFFEGDLEQTVAPVMQEIEKRLSWQPDASRPLLERVGRIGDALLALKEIEHSISPSAGHFHERLRRLENHILTTLETRWTGGRHDGDVISRVKRLRSAIVPDLMDVTVSDPERRSRWKDLGEIYLVQQLHGYPEGYLDQPTPERILETIERYEEDLTDVARAHFPLRAVIMVGDAIEVGPARDKGEPGDPVMLQVRDQLERMLVSTASFGKITTVALP